MISVTPALPDPVAHSENFAEVEYFLRRADEETVAAIRSNDARVHASHAGLARQYSLKSHELLSRLDESGE